LNLNTTGFNYQNQNLLHEKKQIVKDEEAAMNEFMHTKHINKNESKTSSFSAGKDNTQ